jgi:hypothetical protein
MNGETAHTIRRWFDPEQGVSNHQISRWIFLRALGLVYFSAFYSLIFQIRGLNGPHGIFPVAEYLTEVASELGSLRFWFAPTLLWFSSSSHTLMALCWVGVVASMLVVANVWPRATLMFCFVCFLSFVGAAGDFSGYQSDSMLLEAGFISLFFVPGGFFPGWGVTRFPPRASLFLLQWEWFRIYLESGVAKLASGDLQWRHLRAMDEYYQNGPPYLDWLVWAASAALVSCVDCCGNACDGTRDGMDAVSAAALENSMFPTRHAVADCCHPDGELRVLELHCLGAWFSAIG